MKKCPVCGVMMGDNVARCSMCKYDFQKASLGDADKAIAEATSNLAAKEAEAAARVAEKRTEEEKHLLETRARIEKEITLLQGQYDTEKQRLDLDFQEFQKLAFSEKSKIDAELEVARKELDDVRSYATKARSDADKDVEEKRIAGQKEYDEMLELAKKEQQRIITEAQQETEALAIQVEKEFTEAMQKRDEILVEAKDLQDFVANADKVMADKNKELQDYDAQIAEQKAAKQAELDGMNDELVKLQKFYDEEKIRLQEEADRISMEQANEALKLKEQADAERRAINEEKEAIIADIEQRRVDAQVELDQLVEQAKTVIAEAEEATKKRDEMTKVIEEAKIIEAKRIEDEKQIAEYERVLSEAVGVREATLNEWESKIDATKKEYEEAVRIIADAKVAEQQAEAICQEIILNAEKQAVFLKEAALSESEKGKILQLVDEKEQQIRDMEQQRDQLLAEIENMKKSIDELKQRMAEATSIGAALKDGPKEYAVEVVSHNAAGEVDYSAISSVLAKKASEGWKLVNVINDEGGKLQSSLGGSESASLSTGVYASKEDRVVLIFERSREK